MQKNELRVYINAVWSGTSVHLEARLPNGERVPFKKLVAWSKKAKATIKDRLVNDYKYDPEAITFIVT